MSDQTPTPELKPQVRISYAIVYDGKEEAPISQSTFDVDDWGQAEKVVRAVQAIIDVAWNTRKVSDEKEIDQMSSYQELRDSYKCYDCFEVSICQAQGYIDEETGRGTCLDCYKKEQTPASPEKEDERS